MKPPTRRPAAFAVNDPNVVITETDMASAEIVPQTPGQEIAPIPIAKTGAGSRRFGLSWAVVFWLGFGGLAALAIGLAIAQLVESLYTRSQVLGWLGIALASLSALALVAIIIREIRALIQLSAIDELRDRAAATIVSDQRAEGVAIARELLYLTRNKPLLNRSRKILSAHVNDIIDGADMVRLTERSLVGPLDQEAKRLVSAAAKRVAMVTAISPRALLDMVFVFATAFGLMRQLAYLYGGRPGTLGMIRLARLCLAHVTLTGGIAVGDGLVQQILGHGVLAKLSTRLGEGMLNGLLTARLGLAAIEVTRPLPFVVLPQPTLHDLASEFMRQIPGVPVTQAAVFDSSNSSPRPRATV
jgi:putative membrane protein